MQREQAAWEGHTANLQAQLADKQEELQQKKEELQQNKEELRLAAAAAATADEGALSAALGLQLEQQRAHFEAALLKSKAELEAALRISNAEVKRLEDELLVERKAAAESGLLGGLLGGLHGRIEPLQQQVPLYCLE
jgi:hypothetical protein